jgi:DNA-binding MarR family transcriptional regulator
MNPSFHERELNILEAIHNRRHIKQRDLAHILGISVGMTNAIIRRLVQKGLLTVRKVNNRNIRYAVSSDGMEALAKRSVRYLKSTIRSVVDSKEAIEELVIVVKRLGYSELYLVGSSALDFVVEHVCGKFGVRYGRAPGPEPPREQGPPLAEAVRETYFLFSENYEEPEDHQRESHGYLRTILSSKPSPAPGEAEQIRHSAGSLW